MELGFLLCTDAAFTSLHRAPGTLKVKLWGEGAQIRNNV